MWGESLAADLVVYGASRTCRGKSDLNIATLWLGDLDNHRSTKRRRGPRFVRGFINNARRGIGPFVPHAKPPPPHAQRSRTSTDSSLARGRDRASQGLTLKFHGGLPIMLCNIQLAC